MWALFTRSNILFLLGSLGFSHELLIQEQERPWLLAACCTMMGLKLALKGDEKIRGSGSEK